MPHPARLRSILWTSTNMPDVPLWLYFVAFLAVLGPLVFVHEYGHYIVGRWCGVKADTFSIGFGRKILGWTDERGTEWKIGWLPLGGYVQFAGDRDAVSQPDADWQALPAEEKSQSFPGQPVWKRVGVAAFYGAGEVGTGLGQLRLAEARTAGGVGLRIALDQKEKINIRIDQGIGQHGSGGTYFTLGEAF